jgi:hypothetical protein
MRVLGISAYYHDSAAAMVRDGNIIAAAQEERFTRKKHDSSFPVNAVEYCLAEEGVKLEDVDYIVFYDKPFLKFERLLETYLAMAPRGLRSFRMAIPLWIREKLFQKKLLGDELKHFSPGANWEQKLLFTEHHMSHAASAFFPSRGATADWVEANAFTRGTRKNSGAGRDSRARGRTKRPKSRNTVGCAARIGPDRMSTGGRGDISLGERNRAVGARATAAERTDPVLRGTPTIASPARATCGRVVAGSSRPGA